MPSDLLKHVKVSTPWQIATPASSLGDIADRNVSLRYAYGGIRLTRLNLYAPLLLGRSHFQRVRHQYGSYFARFYGPILFVIGIMSVVLSGLQVVVSVGEDGEVGWTGEALGFGATAISPLPFAPCVLSPFN
ncbi:hypothetical protein B0I35DRAFT_490818 [Stachybotrys elegans]|uniref:Uncharacterized protein n=1 Tax=Stachybotrys elegans TaxID=80388 RepID=A0A8K0SIX2_9HYPO|nr:hypothetical protein B0I35DRAFT_490818 [Stachybotrys elegans]